MDFEIWLGVGRISYVHVGVVTSTEGTQGEYTSSSLLQESTAWPTIVDPGYPGLAFPVGFEVVFG